MLGVSSMNHTHRKAIPLDLAAIRDRLGTARGPQYWRSLEELAKTDAFREFLQREFPEQTTECGCRDRDGQSTMNRLYPVESTPSITGAMADHHLTLRAQAVADFAYAVARKLGALDLGDRGGPTLHPQWLQAVVSNLQRQRGASLVLAGEQQPPLVHALAHAMNHACGVLSLAHSRDLLLRNVERCTGL